MPNIAAAHWSVLASEPAGDYGLFRVTRDRARSPHTGNDHDVLAVHMSDWLTVVPLTAKNALVMVRQYRHGSRSIDLELPGGLLDHRDESPAAGVQRELLEETGYGGGDLISLGKLWPQPAFLSNRIWLFAMTGVAFQGEQILESGEEMEVVIIKPESISERIRSGEIGNAMTICALALAQKHTGNVIF